MLSRYLEFIETVLSEVRRAMLRFSVSDDRAKVVGRSYYGDESILMDRVADETVRAVIADFFDDYTYISEEYGIMKKGKGIPYILVDPLDGSTNAKRGISHFCTAVAVAEGPNFEDIVASGVIEHRTGDMVWGLEGTVYDGWKKARPSNKTDLENSVVFIDSKFRSNPENPEGYLALIRSTKYPRMIGAAAWEIALVAIGRAEAAVAYPGSLRTFDCLPSLYLLKGAGGKALYIGKRPKDLLSKERIRFIAAGNEELLNRLKAVLKVEGLSFF